MTRPGPLPTLAALAGLGAAAIQAATVPVLWGVTPAYAILFAVLAAAQVGTLPRPRPAALAAGAGLVVWVLDRVVDVLPGPSPWQAADTALGVTDWLAAALQALALLGFLIAGFRASRPGRSRALRVTAWLATAPVAVLVLAIAAAGVVTASAGARSSDGARTVEYCRPAGIPLHLDLYPPAGLRHAPVAVYLHGGGFMLGDRRPGGAGAALANSDGALFPPLQRELTARGFVVASIDYRLLPAAAWPAPIDDARCAIRFLKAHAGELRIDPARIGVWGSSAGGTLSALLGTAASADRTSSVAAVVDMFGPADLTHLDAADPAQRLIVHIGLGDDAATRRSASPDRYVTPHAAPTLILQGDEDFVRPQSAEFAQRLRAAGVPVTSVLVHGTGHTLDTPGQSPGPAQLTTLVADFLTTALR
ncbi:alpha/beta hydrolase fold domain-containing protein [Amycolatopsis sp. NPDC051903]|uniref:alpha/beta hydrolase fold domain-containing protein n=1 Tax=Amycolatopsis sp. NPDC051903 TaxID=3363936 RepID=UPI0037BBEC1F